MNGPGIRPGRMVLLTSGIVDERPPCRGRRSVLLSAVSLAAGVEPAVVHSSSRPDTLLGSQGSGS